jgi:predicted metalloprotease with PDZ domain
MTSAAQEDPGEYDEVTVTIEIPPLSEFPAGWAKNRDGCPHMRISRTLGAKMSGGGGVRIFEVEPDKPAAKAGIQPGDRLGELSDCASSLSRSFRPRKEARTIEWTVRRPKGDAAERFGREGSAEGGAG